jgi:glycosyltransferase involved in cell wall biosynthesis
MKVLMVHNRYQQRGGEDSVVCAEVDLLAGNGIEVRRFDADNDSIHGVRSKLQVSASQFGSPSAVQSKMSEVLADFRPDVVHVHNWFPTISASIFRTCHQARIPVVHTLHNYRLLCINATLFRDGHVCEDCVGKTLRTPGILHKCYRQSPIGSVVATAGMLTHWAMGTWHNSVDRFIALSEFSRRKLIEGGLPAEKIVVKPNFVEPDPGPGPGDGGYLLYVGRLTEEKGLRTLLQCWRMGPDLPLLRIAGTGPLQDEVAKAAASLPNVEWLGSKDSKEVTELMRHAMATICPSLWFEGMPRVVIESFAVGTPVVASNIGSYPEMIAGKGSGVLFPPGDSNALRDCIRALYARKGFAEMRPNARQQFEAEYTGGKNLSLILNIYRDVLFAGQMVASTVVHAGT